MTNYKQELQPPEYRNLVINPSGEATSLGASHVASNGTVRTGVPSGAGVPAALSGTGVTEYEVLDNTSNSYEFGPLGPLEPVHRGAFRIPESGQVTARVSVWASAASWVEVQASWLAEEWDNGEPAGVSEIARTVVLPAQAVDNTAWVELEMLVAQGGSPDGATHWRPMIVLYSADPSVDPAPPAIGTKIWADQFFVTDSGADLAGVAYGDGDQPGWEWEDNAHHSSSRTAAPVETDPVGLTPDTSGEDEFDADPDPVNDEVGDSEIASSDEPPEPPSPPDASEDDPGRRPASARPAYAEAEDVIAWKSSNRNVHLHEDIQLGDLVMNRMDEQGVVWLVSDLEGWWTAPAPEVPDVERGWFDGSYETRGRYNARTFEITGSFIPHHPGDVAQARDKLVRALDLVHRGGWFMTHEGSNGTAKTKGSKVWLVGQPLIATTGQNGKTDFSIPLRAPNPVKQSIKDGVPPGYESMKILTSSSQYPERDYPRTYPWAFPEAVFGSTVAQVVNEGNAVVWPILRLAGPTNGPLRVYNADTGQEFRIVKKLYPGEVLEVDCFTKQVTLNGGGNHRFYLDVDVDWLTLKPGPNKIFFSEEIIGGIRTELEVMWRSGWIG